MKISVRSAAIPPSPTIGMNTRAQLLRKQGRNVLSFAVGEPDFPTPAHIVAAAEQAMRDGFTKYTAPEGIPELREAVAMATTRDLGVAVDPAGVVVSNGGKHALANIFLTLLDPGDHVIVIAPYWVSYAELILLAGGWFTVVPTSLENGFQPNLEAVAEAVHPRSVAVLINSPSNPSGAVLDRATVEGLAALAEQHDLAIISDEIYKHIVYDGVQATSPALLGPETAARTIIADGVAKTYSMTGWRIGWSISGREFATAAGDLQSQMTSNPCSISQKAALAALTGPQDCVAEFRQTFAARRQVIVDALSQLPGLECPWPAGAFYVFPRVEGLFGRSLGGATAHDSLGLAELLLEKAEISTVPGSAFGSEGYLRFSFACSTDQLQEGASRLRALLG